MANGTSLSQVTTDTDLQSLGGMTDLQPVEGVDYLDVRQKLLDKYRSKRESLLKQVANNPASTGVDHIMSAVIEEIVQETENLLGNEILLMTSGQVEKASVISVKRSDVLDILSKVAARKKEMSVTSSEVDLSSPAFQLFQALCFEKLTLVLESLNLDKEMCQLIVTRWGDKMSTWDRELEQRLAEAKE